MVFPGSHLLGPLPPFHTDSYTLWPWPSQRSLNFERIGNAKFSSWVARRPLGYYKGQKWIEKEKYSWVWGRERIKLTGCFYFLSQTLFQSSLTQFSPYWFLNSHYHKWNDSPKGVLISQISLALFHGLFPLNDLVSSPWVMATIICFSYICFSPQIVSVFTFKIYKDYCKKNKLGRQAVTWVKVCQRQTRNASFLSL